MPSTWSSQPSSHSTARKARCASSPCVPGSTFATAAAMAYPSPSSPGRASTRAISVLDAVGLPRRARAAFSAISSSTMVTIRASPASPDDFFNSLLGVDFYAFSLYKTFGPHLGLLYVKRELWKDLAPQNHFFIPEAPDKLLPGGANHELTAGLVGIADYFDLLDRH